MTKPLDIRHSTLGIFPGPWLLAPALPSQILTDAKTANVATAVEIAAPLLATSDMSVPAQYS